VGAPPFQAQGAGEIIALQLFAKPEPPSTRVAVGADLEAIALRLLEKEPAARYASAAEVGDALARVLQRLDVRVSMPLAAAEPRASASHARAPLAVPTLDAVSPPPKSKLPIIAGAITVAVAAAVVLVIARGTKHEAPTPAPPPPPAPAAVVDPPKPPPPRETVEELAVPDPPKPKPKQKAPKGPTTQNGSPYFDKL